MAGDPASGPTWVPAYVGVGSNLDDPVVQVRAAVEQLAALRDTRLIRVSPLYRNPPMGDIPQPDCVNAVAGLLTRLPPLELLAALKAIEAARGRDRAAPRWGPRIIDLDLLVYGAEVRTEGPLVLPHQGISERNFVLWPLLDIAPGLRIPGLGAVQDLAAAVDASTLVRID